MSDFFDEIVESDAAKICIIAAPGSGKTSRVLLPKLERILAEPGRIPQEVVVLTFSRVSALDLKRRVARLPIVPRATTVHSFALQFLLSENNHAIRERIESILLDFHKDILLADIKAILNLRKGRG